MSNSFIYPNNFLFNFFYSNAGLQIRGDDFLFGSVFIKKITKTGSNRPVSIRLFGKKPVQAGLARFFPVWLSFFRGFLFGFGLVFSVPSL